MAEEQKGSSSGGIRFRLPKLFAESTEGADTTDSADATEEASETGVLFHKSQRGGERSGDDAPTDAEDVPFVIPPYISRATGAVPPRAVRPISSSAAPVTPSVTSHAATPVTPAAAATSGAATAGAPAPVGAAGGAEIAGEIARMHDALSVMYHMMTQINERESAQEKVFNTLHEELQSYKNDFIYEHLKPVVRPLLFLFDSLEQFEAEMALQELPAGEERRSGVSPTVVRENLVFFQEQLVEALRICEVVAMERPQGLFDARLHKAVGVVKVDAAQDNHIQRVVRSGWFLNGQLLRPADVVVGKAGLRSAT